MGDRGKFVFRWFLYLSVLMKTTQCLNNTTAEVNSTSQAVSEESSTVNYTTSTPATETSTVPIIPLVPQKQGVFILREEGFMCLKATFQAQFSFTYQNKAGQRVEQNVDMPPLANYTGWCADKNNTAGLSLAWSANDFNFSMIFHLTNGKEKHNASLTYWHISHLHLTHKIGPPDFVGPDTDTAVIGEKDQHLFSTPFENSYVCKAGQVFKLTSDKNKTVILKMTEIQLQPTINDVPASSDFKKGVVCAEDKPPFVPEDNTIPIVVAVCLCATILALLIGYALFKVFRKYIKTPNYERMS